MAYNIQYRTSYKRFSNNITTIDILEKNSAYNANPTILLAASEPLIINSNTNTENIYKPTVGSGATIKLLVSPLTMLALFTVDPQKYMVKVYNGNSGATLIWQGFINTGVYTEDYSQVSPLLTPITLQCNDGMSILDSLPYSVTGTEAKYTGFVTVGVVMSNIFSKLAVGFDNIITACDLRVNNIPQSNLFYYLKVNNENYYNEQGIAMTCREVLDSIFGALSLVVSLRSNIIYIIDPINLHDTDNGKIYATSPVYGYGETDYTDLGGYLDISNKDLLWYETGQTVDVVQPYNQVDIKYDPFDFTEYTYDFNSEGAASGGTWVSDGSVSGGTGYWYNSTVSFPEWTYSSGLYGNGSKELEADVPTYYINQVSTCSGFYEYTIPFSNIKQDEAYRLRLLMDVYINTGHGTNIYSADPITYPETLVQTVVMPVYLRVGNQWYGGDYDWSSGFQSFPITVRTPRAKQTQIYTRTGGMWFWKTFDYVDADESIVNDTWTTCEAIINMGQSGGALVNGSISFYIPKAVSLTTVVPWTSENDIENVLIRNLKIQSLTDTLKPITNSTQLTKGTKFNTQSTIDTFEVKLTNGCGLYGSSRGAFSTDQQVIPGINITGLYRADNLTTKYTTSQLLAQNMISQYCTPRLKLSVNLNCSTYLLNIDKHLIKDTNYLGSKAFYVISHTYNDANESSQLEMIELVATREPITI